MVSAGLWIPRRASLRRLSPPRSSRSACSHAGLWPAPWKRPDPPGMAANAASAPLNDDALRNPGEDRLSEVPLGSRVEPGRDQPGPAASVRSPDSGAAPSQVPGDQAVSSDGRTGVLPAGHAPVIHGSGLDADRTAQPATPPGGRRTGQAPGHSSLRPPCSNKPSGLVLPF